MEIIIERLQEKDAAELFKFESENRSYFEKSVPNRGDEYYNIENFKIKHKELLEEQEKQESYFYLIKDQSSSIIGRINVVDIDRTKNIGHVGYRVGEIHTGKGIANKALKLLLTNISSENINKLHAKTTSINIASQKVLERNGFTRVITDDEEFVMNDQTYRFVHFVWSRT
ncbi:GNAT family N-acetyltransferase [Psychrobacillus vulpis]|uniref:GNAT family N-acetyltransferase n=1 Tax=Psychrobacillus vulpis TaxID=2325572 RepID=A0A544TW71_9BACI|nr:GNAT family N-acetyltransferase [Psychrobacillus vulpis]TQR21702.1 GNAT family N-acetyltransferase [Psychrobacillus vulpis]